MRSHVLMSMVGAAVVAQLWACSPPAPGCTTDADCDKTKEHYCDEAEQICKTAGGNGEGQEGKACWPSGRCDDGLTCAGALCVASSGGSSSSSGMGSSSSAQPSSSSAGSSSSSRPSSSSMIVSSSSSMGSSSSAVVSSSSAMPSSSLMPSSSSVIVSSSSSVIVSSSSAAPSSSLVASSSSAMPSSSSVMGSSSSMMASSSSMMPVSVSFAVAMQTVSESAGTVMVEVKASGPTSANLMVPYTVMGSAVRPQDHNAQGGSVTIPMGMDRAAISIQIVDDAVLESDETIILTLMGTNVVMPATHTLTIDDNEMDTQVVPPVSVDTPAGGSTVFTQQVTYSGGCEYGGSIAITYVDRAAEFAPTMGMVNPASVTCEACTTAENPACGTAPNQRGKFSFLVGFAGGEGAREIQLTQTDSAGNTAAAVSHFVTYSPLPSRLAYLKASNTEAGDAFGSSVATDGDWIVVGAPFESSTSAAMPGSNAALSAGAVYVFQKVGGTVVPKQMLKASNAGAGDTFGYSVAVHGNTIVVGAPVEASLNGSPSDDSAPTTGAAYVYEFNGTTWAQSAYLKAQVRDAGDLFGTSVAIYNDLIVVGAPGESGAGTGTTSNPSSNGAAGSGAAYVFLRNGTAWMQQAYLKASNTGMQDGFGQSVAVFGTRVAVGAPFEDSPATGINGLTGDGANESGAVYTYVSMGGVWNFEAYFKASNTNMNDGFGQSVALSADHLAVGAPFEQSNATGINGNQTSNAASTSGAAYLFQFLGGAWMQRAYIKPSNTEAQDQFGYSVAIAGNLLLVGAPFEDSSAVDVNGNQQDNTATDSGAAYLFTIPMSGLPVQKAYLKASNTGAADNFGTSVDISALMVVGAPFERSAATNVNGDQSSNAAQDSGAAYVFQ